MMHHFDVNFFIKFLATVFCSIGFVLGMLIENYFKIIPW